MTALLSSLDEESVVELHADDGRVAPTGLAPAAATTGGLADAGLVSDVVPGPLGPLLAVATSAGLVGLSLLPPDPDAEIARIARAVSRSGDQVESEADREGAAAEHLRQLEGQLGRYFAGSLRDFDVALDSRLVRGPFARRVLETICGIPYGEVATYGQVAEMAGRPRAARAAGNALAANPLMVVVPCHRVVPSGGGVGNYGGGSHRKTWLLELEGALPSASPTG